MKPHCLLREENSFHKALQLICNPYPICRRSVDEQVVSQLGKACPESAVKVALVEKTYSIWLLDLLYKQKVTAHGYCTK